jgi:hypothetical protein
MKPDEAAVVADQHVGRDGWDQLSTSLGYREYYRVRIAGPVDVVARGAGELGSGCSSALWMRLRRCCPPFPSMTGVSRTRTVRTGPRETFPLSSSSTVPG